MARAKMKMGECRLTKNGQRYCKTRKGVRFVKGRGRNLSGSRRTGRGRKCKRFKRVHVKGTRGTQRRCAAYK